jgi:hypothetical protein
MKGVVLGLIVGAVIAGGAVKLWSNGQIDSMVKTYQDDEQELNHLKGENSTLRTTLNSLESNAYNRDSIKVCIMKDGLRSTAMNTYLSGGMMSDLERGAFQDFGPMLPSIAGKSAQAKLVLLSSENAKLTNECLDGAKIPVPAFAKD